MLLRNLLTREHDLSSKILTGLRDPLWSSSLFTSSVGTDYDVKITNDFAEYKMLVPGRSDEEINLEIINDTLIIKAEKKGWLPGLHFEFGAPAKRNAISAQLEDGVLTVKIEIAKESTANGKIKIEKK